MWALNSNVLLGLLYAGSIVLCAPRPSPNPVSSNLEAGTDGTPPTPVLHTFRRLRKRSKVGEVAGQVRAALDAGNSGVPKLIADVQKMQKDLEAILKQLKAAGLIPGSKNDKRPQDLKKDDTVTDVTLATEATLADDDSDSETTDTEPTPSPVIVKDAPAAPEDD